jgi:hypothetical protein
MTPDFEIDGHKALGFDTCLNARAFAQAKFAQCITEPGLIVRPAEAPPHQVQLWKASGVREVTGANGESTMVIWGPPVEGERLDALLDALCSEDQSPDKVLAADRALAAVSLWIQAILALGENTPWENFPFWPSAAIIAQGGEGRAPSVFFAPSALIRHSVTAHDEWYVNPGLGGMEAAAFTAAAMLYRLFAGAPPFSAATTSVLHEDMRDGNFLPPHLAVPGLDSRLAALIYESLTQRRQGAKEDKKFTNLLENSAPLRLCEMSFRDNLGEILKVIQTGGQTVAAASLVHPLAEPDRLLLEKEKAQFLKIKTASIKARRFVARNTALLLGILGAAVAAAFIVYSIVSSRALLPTTAGMDPVQVIESYYHGFGELDHQMMEACVIGAAGKNDITAVINYFVMNKTRQAYEFNAPPLVFPAHQWQGGDPPDTPLFGAADVRVELLAGDESGSQLRYRVDYTFWIPEQITAEEALNRDSAPPSGSLPYPRRDFLTLVRQKGNWRIAEINRVLENL